MTINELKQLIQNLPDDFNVEIEVMDADQSYSSFLLDGVSVEVEHSERRIVFSGVFDSGE